MAYLSFPSLKNTQSQPHAKNRITLALLELVERHHPGFRNLVEYSELATP